MLFHLLLEVENDLITGICKLQSHGKLLGYNRYSGLDLTIASGLNAKVPSAPPTVTSCTSAWTPVETSARLRRAAAERGKNIASE